MIHALTLRVMHRHLAHERKTSLALAHRVRLATFSEQEMTGLRNDIRNADDQRAAGARLRLDHSS
jgi:hypothetical protein